MEGTAMLKISIVEARTQRRLVLEGMLIAPWADELISACGRARVDLDGRDLVIELKNLTAINQQGENALIALMSEGVQFSCRGVFAKEVVVQLVRRTRKQCQLAEKLPI
jgi:hypothetical protein